MIREFCEFVKIQFYTQTPLVALYILFMTVIVFAPILGLETFSRAAEIFFPLIVLLLFVLIIFSLPDVEFENFLPMFENGIKPIIHGAIKYQFFTSLQLVVFLVIMPSLDGGGSDKKPFFIGVLSAGFILTLLTSLAIGVLGTKLIHLLNYPNFVLARNIYIGDFVTRIEVFIVWIWFLTIFFKSVLYFYALSFGIAQSLKLSDHRMLIIPLGIIIIVCAMIISPNPVYYTEALPYWNSFIVTMGLVIPLLILGIAKIRKL